MMDDRETIVRLALLLDAAMPAFDRWARIERDREKNKTIRQITAQERATAARELLKEVAAKYGLPI